MKHLPNVLKSLALAASSVVLTIILTPSTAQAQCEPDQEVGVNLVVNGDFEDPTIPFETDYPTQEESSVINGHPCVLGSDCTPPNHMEEQCQCHRNWSMPGEYWVGDDVSRFHFNFGGVQPSGDYSLFVDGDCNEGTKVWCQQVEVVPNTNYFFTASIASIGEATANLNADQIASLKFTVGNVELPDRLESTATVGEWVTVETVWNSQNNSGLMELCIENTAVGACDNGNDFVIDDISFTGGCAFGDPGPAPDLGEDFTICGMNLPVTLNPNLPGGTDILWSTGATTPTIDIPGPGTYAVCVTQNGSCPRSDIITVLADYEIDLGPDLELCNPVSAELDPGYSGPGVTYAWTLDGQPLAETGQTLTVTEPGVYEVTVNDPGCGPRTDQVTVTSQLVTTDTIRYCPGNVALTAEGSTTYNFYENEDDVTPIASGATGTVDLSAGGDHIFWVEDGERTVGAGVGPSITGYNQAGTDQGDRRMRIQVSQKMRLETVDFLLKFYSAGSQSGSIRLFDSSNNGTPLFTSDPITVNATNGGDIPHTATLNWDIEPGEYYLALGGNLSANYKSDAVAGFPFTYDDEEGEEVFSLLPTKDNEAWGYDAVYFFHNFDVSTGTKCGRVPLVVIEDCPCQPPTAVISGGGEICEGETAPSITIDITAGDINTADSWDIIYAIDGVEQPEVNVTDPSLLLLNPEEGEYTLISVSENVGGIVCIATDMTGTAEVIINPLPEPELTDATICDLETEILDPGQYTGYEWSTGEQTATLDATDAGDYTVTVTDNNGCEATASMTLTVNELPVPVLDDNTTCDGFDVTLDPGVFDNYAWSTGDTDPTIDVGTAGVYTVTVTDDIGCEGIDDMTLVVNDGPEFTITDDVEMCLGETATLTINLTGTGPFDVTYNDGTNDIDLVGISDGETFEYSGLSTITFTPVSATDDNGCTSQGGTGATVTINPLPTGQLTGATTICYGDAADLTFTMTGEAPFDIAYSDGTNDIPLLGVTSPHIESVSPTATTTYTLVGVMDANGCAAPQLVDQTVTVEVSPSGSLSGDAVICEGESTDLEFQFDEAGTYDVTYNDGVSDIDLVAISSGHTVTVTPDATTTYTMISVIESGSTACPGAPDGAPVVTVIPLPEASITGDNAICIGDNTDLTFNITGEGPFDLVYTDGVSNFNLNGAIDGELANVSPNATTTYSIVSVMNSTVPQCVGASDGSDATITINEAPEVVSQVNTCLSTEDYETEIVITGGDAGSYQVNGATDGIAGDTFTSDALANNDPATPHVFLIDDANGCGPVEVNVNYDCQCETDVNTMVVTPIEACTPDDISATWNFADTVMEPGDVSMFILHTNATGSAGTIIDQNNTGTFSFDDGTMTVNTTYYISAVLGPDLGDGTPDLTSSCTRVAIGTPVLWNPLPTLTIADDANICVGQSATLTFTMTGDGPFEIVYSDGTDDFTLSNINSGHTESVSPTATTTYTLVSVTDGNAPVCTGTTAGTAEITVTEPPTYSAITYTCDINKEWYTAEFTVENAVAGSFDITGEDSQGNVIGGTLTGLVFTSDQIPNDEPVTFYINPVSSCDPVPVAVHRLCECDTEVGTMLATQLDLCQGETATATHNGDEFLDANDIMMYVLHDNNTNVLGNILASNTVPEFTYLQGMVYGQVYYISAVAGNDIGDGATVDLLGDKCAQVSIGQPVTFSQAPVATIAGEMTICIGSQVTFDITLEGTAPFDFSFTNGTDVFDVTGETGNTYTFNDFPIEDTEYELISVTDASAATCPGSVSGTAIANVPGELIIETVTLIDPTCSDKCDGVLGAQVDIDNDPLVQSGDYSWYDDAGNFISTGQIQQDVCAGDYVVVADNGVCQVEHAVSLVAPDPVTAIITDFNDPSCNGYTDGDATVTAGGGTVAGDYNYTWSSGDNAAQATPLPAGDYVVSVTDDNDCQATTSITLTDPDAVVLTIVSFDRIVCPEGPASLVAAASGGNAASYTYYWSGDATIDDPSVAGVTTAPLVATTYSVSATDANDCPSNIETARVEIYGPVDITGSISETDICEGEAVLLDHDGGNGGDGNYTITWAPSDGGPSFTGSAPQSVTPTDTETTYDLTLTDGCNQTATDAVSVTIQPTPDTEFEPEITIACEFVTVEFTNTTAGMTGNETCDWTFDALPFSSASCDQATVIYVREGKHTVSYTITNEYGCANTETWTDDLLTAPNPDISFTYGPASLSMLMSTATFTPTDASGGASIAYDWDFGDGFTDTVEVPTHQFPFDRYGEYLVELVGTNEYGCTDTTEQTIIVTGDYVLNAPNAFTPDKDGLNDVFIPKGIGLDPDDWAFYVYNRWGDLIFETNNIAEGWDGTIKETGQEAKQDVYTWQVYTSSAYDITSDKIIRTGRVTIVR